jgi:Fe-S-cluster-containing dehydrogenase component/formate-dependent nitrite reductase membrane component NrfD
MRYGFVIDQERCIGCHACTLACKEEHEVPIGVFRTWVKYVETGNFPQTRRHFGVMRCNHCDDAPCIEICPTHSLFRRPDGIVDFDNQRCIGCKSCMHACPYDALYIDPNSNTAAKCNFCAHRIEKNLEPACVIVCPTQAILAGDMDDKSSKPGAVIASRKTSVRKPEKKTLPKVRYVAIHNDLLQPTHLTRQNGFLWADRRDQPVTVGSFDATATREVYDVSHPAPWGWKIAAYLWTKSIGAGVLLVAAVLMGFFAAPEAVINVISPLIALAGVAATAALLVCDLKRPDRFYYLLTKPNLRSWLVLGGYILMFYGALAAAWLAVGYLHRQVPPAVVWAAVAFAMATAGYSAFLFGQARGRDFWRHKWFFCWQLVVQAFSAGSAALVIVSVGFPGQLLSNPSSNLLQHGLRTCLGLSLLAGTISVLVELNLPRRTEEDRLAKRSLIHGASGRRFWISAVTLGLISPLVLVGAADFFPAAIGIASVLTLYGLFWFDYLWVRAGQSVPLS